MSTGKAIVNLSETNQIEALESYASDAGFEAANGAGGAGDIYHNTTENVVRWHNGTAWQTVFHVPIRPGMYGLGLESVTGSVAADTIRLTGYDGADLSSDAHHGYAVLPHQTTAGALSVFRVSANIDRLLTGAPWSRGGFGDFTDIPHAVYLINDTGTLKLGVTEKPGLRVIADTNSSATPSSVNAYHKMLVNTALNAGTWPCVEVGGFLTDFDDTGGSSEDLHVIQTGAGEIWLDPRQYPAPSGETSYTTGAGWGSTNTKIRRIETVEAATSKAVAYATSAANGSSWTILEDGTYEINYVDARVGGVEAFGISVNSNQLTTQIDTITASHRKAYAHNVSGNAMSITRTVKVSAGDVVRPHGDGNSALASAITRFSVHKVAHAA
jgi:hypothetical protein